MHKDKVLTADGFLTEDAKTKIEFKIDQFNDFLERPEKKQVILDYFTKCKDIPNYFYSIIDVTETMNAFKRTVAGDYIIILANIIVKKLTTKSFFYTYGPNQDCIYLALILLLYPLKVVYIQKSRDVNAITTELEFKKAREELEKIYKLQALSSERIDALKERHEKMEQSLKEAEQMMAMKYHITSNETAGDSTSNETAGDSTSNVPVDTDLDVTDDPEWDKEFEDSSNVQEIKIKTPAEKLDRMLKMLDEFKRNNQPNENCWKIINIKQKNKCSANEAKISSRKSKIRNFCIENGLEYPFKTTRKGGKRSNKRKTKKSKNCSIEIKRHWIDR
jgi:hypothetical protein